MIMPLWPLRFWRGLWRAYASINNFDPFCLCLLQHFLEISRNPDKFSSKSHKKTLKIKQIHIANFELIFLNFSILPKNSKICWKCWNSEFGAVRRSGVHEVVFHGFFHFDSKGAKECRSSRSRKTRKMWKMSAWTQKSASIQRRTSRLCLWLMPWA